MFVLVRELSLPDRSHNLEWRPSLATSLSEKNPPANTPKDPPMQDAKRIQ